MVSITLTGKRKFSKRGGDLEFSSRFNDAAIQFRLIVWRLIWGSFDCPIRNWTEGLSRGSFSDVRSKFYVFTGIRTPLAR